MSKTKPVITGTTTVLILSTALPVALLLWLGYICFLYIFKFDPEMEQIPPARWLAATLLPTVFIVWGLRKKSLSKSGAAFAAIVGFILTLSSYCFVTDLLAFFLSSSKLTKFRSDKKRLLEEDFKEGGQRNWVQVVCNGGMATLLAAFYITDAAVGELPLNFVNYYRATWLSLGVMGAFACANGDTWASEIGSVVGGTPVLVTTWRKVPRGTNGGITLGGVVCSFLGGMVVAIAHYLTVIYYVDERLLKASGPQWPIVIIGGLTGMFGSLLDSFLGATVQYSGMDKKRGCIVEHPGPEIVHISGSRLLDNHSVNLISTVVAGIMTPTLAQMFWH